MASNSIFSSSRPLRDLRKLFEGIGRRTTKPKHADAPAGVSFQERLVCSTHLHDTLPEILLMIFDYLDTASLVCFQSTCKFLQKFIRIDPKGLDRCTRWLVMCYFEKDTLAAASLGNTPAPKSLCCAKCKIKHPRRNFDGISLRYLFSSPKNKQKHYFNRALPLLPSIERVCALAPPKIGYVGDSTGYTFLSRSGDPLPQSSELLKKDRKFWLVVRLLSCSHCSAAISLDLSPEEEQGEEGNWERERETGCGKCRCVTCPRVMRPFYLRFGKLWAGARVLKVERFLWDKKAGIRIVEKGARKSIKVLEIGLAKGS